jgi:uncharacterized protein YyaL (SSP411 family)
MMGAERTERPYLEAALKAEKWIAGTAVAGREGTAWPADPKDPKSVNSTLYAGNPGVVLFYLELYAATGDKDYLKKASAGADFLIAGLPEEKTMGLYEGLKDNSGDSNPNSRENSWDTYRIQENSITCPQTFPIPS